MPQITQPEFSAGGAIGGGSSIIPQVFSAVLDPTVNSDAVTIGARVGDRWVNTATGNEWTAKSVATGAARWAHTTRTLAQSGAILTAPANDTNENTLVTVAVAAGAMGVNGMLRVTTLWSYTNSGNVKTKRVRLGGTEFLALANTTQASSANGKIITNRNSAAAQVSFNAASGGFGNSTGAVATGTVNTAVAQDLLITAQKATGTETISLESYTVELLRPDIS